MSRKRLSQVAIFAIVFFCLLDDVTPMITVFPQNAVIVVSESTRFNCTTNRTATTNPITWNFNNAGKIGSGCYGADPRFQGVPSGDANECDVLVKSNQLDVAGTYTCIDFDANKQREAVLLVLVSQPTCKLDRPAVRGQQLNVICKPGNVTYGTTATVPVVITQWIACDSLGSLGISNNTTVGQGIVQLPDASFSAVPSGKVISVRCDIHFDFNDNYPTQADTIWAINDLNYPVNTTELVLYCPENITVTHGPYFVGSVLTCSADAYPEPFYGWTNNSNNSSISQQQTISLPAGQFDLNCTAYAAVNLTSVCSNITTRVYGYAIECPHNVIIPVKLAVVKVGQSFNCTATSTPAANYTWYNSTGVVSNTQTVSVTTPGPFSLTCNATVTVDGTTCSSNTSDTVNGTAIECPGAMLITPQTTTTVRVGDTFNCSTSSYPPANYTWYDSLNVVQSTDRTVAVTKAGNFTFTCNASISVGGTTCYNSTNITGYAISCPPNVTILSVSQPSPVGTVYTCSSDSPSNYTTYTWSDRTTVVHTGSSYTANNTGTFVLTCNATVSVGGISCSNVNSTNITVIEVTTTLWSISSETATSNNSSGDATASTAQTGGHTASGANTGKAIAYILPPIFALMALLALVLCIPVVARIVRRRAAAAAAAAASKLPAANQIQQRPMNFDRQLPVWSWSENGPTGLYSPGFNATRPDQINGYGRF